MQWGQHISNVINKAKKTLHAIRLIRKYFNKKELNVLLTSNFYSIMYYNSDIWHIPSLGVRLKGHLLAASASALKLCTPGYNYRMSYATLHYLNNRATPDKMMLYKHALLLYKVYNDGNQIQNWISLNFQQTFNRRSTTFRAFSNHNYTVGKNLAVNRLTILNGIIELNELNLSKDSYKVHCKSKFLTNWTIVWGLCELHYNWVH